MLHWINTETNLSTKLSEEPTIHSTARIIDSRIGSWTYVSEDTEIIESTFDDYSYTAGSDVSIIYSEIGKFCSIASHVRINPGNHPMKRVAQHHFTYRRIRYGFNETDDENFFNWRRSNKCIIGNDVWIGHNAIIMPGVRIGSGAVVGAGAVVTKNIFPYEIAVGVPAKPIRKRFTDDIIEKLLKIEWWNWDRKSLEENFADFFDLNTFIEKHYK